MKKRSQVSTSSAGDCGAVAGAEEAWRVSVVVVVVDEGARAFEGGTRDVIDGRVGCRVLSHGLSAVLKADLEGLERWETRAMDVRGLRREGWGVMRVAIVCWTPFQALCVLGTMEGGGEEDRRRLKRARTAEVRACE